LFRRNPKKEKKNIKIWRQGGERPMGKKYIYDIISLRIIKTNTQYAKYLILL